MKKALITGICGQDGVYLSAFLLEKGYEVHGLQHRAVPIRPLNYDVIMHRGDVSDGPAMADLISDVNPDEIYNLAAISFVPDTWKIPNRTLAINCGGLFNIIMAMSPETKIYQASTSEMFGNSGTGRIDRTQGPTYSPHELHEEDAMLPESPYAVAKLAAHHYARLARDRGVFACSGILFNHESPLRGPQFVTQKIATAAGMGVEVELGNLHAARDWGFAGDYVKAMWLMLQHDEPDDYVIGTGIATTVMDFCRMAYRVVGLNFQDYVKGETQGLLRHNEVHYLCANYSKAKRVLGWEPTVNIQELVTMMVDSVN